MTELTEDCVFCTSPGGRLVWENALCRVVDVADPDYPGFCRVILKRHVREMTDLAADEQREVMRIVFAVEAVLRRLLDPDKINIASLGNMVPHVHWHVIPRWCDDRCFPNPIWGDATHPAASVAAFTTIPDPEMLARELAAQLGASIASAERPTP